MAPYRFNFFLWQVHAAHRKTLSGVIVPLLVLAAVQFVTWMIPVSPGTQGVDNYLTLHAMMEGISIIVAMMVFVVGWNSHIGKVPGNLVVLACLFFAVGCLDFSHTGAYGGMPDFFTPNGPDKHLNFWIVARLLAATALLMVTLRPWNQELQKTSKYALLTSLIVSIIVFNWVVIYHQDALPDLFVPGQGLTPLKKNLEYFCIGINLVTMVLLWGKMRTEQSFNAPLLFAAAAVMGMSEFYFTLYTTMTGAYNVLGHVYKVISYLLIYRAVVVESIERPYLELEHTRSQLARAVEASKYASQSLQKTLDAIPSLVAYWDANLINQYANKAYTDYFGVDPANLLGRHISSLLGEDLYQKNLPFLQAALHGEEQNFERAIPSPNGRPTRYTKTKYLPDIANGKVNGIYVFVYDVSDMRRAVEKLTEVTTELQAAKNRMELATQAGGIGVWEFDVVNNTLQWDDRMYALYGVTRQSHLEPYSAWADRIHPEDRATSEMVLRDALTGLREFDTKFRIIWSDKSVHHIHGSARVERDQDGQPLKMIGVNFDITDEVVNGQKARDSYALMLAAIDSVEEAFVMYDAEDRMVYCNKKYRELYSSTADLIVYGVKFEDIVRQGAERGIYLDAIGRINDFVKERTAAHQSGNFGVTTRLDDGRVMRVIDRKLPNGYIVGFRIDITELTQAKTIAENSAKSKSQFLANMSHEIRTPMNAILGLLNLLQSTELTNRQRDYASKTEGAAQSLLGLLNDILDFSKVEAGKMTLENEPFQIDKIMRTLSVVLSANVGSKNIEVLFDVDPELPTMVRGDAMRLQQVLVNLGGNAVKFTSEGQVVLSFRKLAQTEHTVTIEFAIQDTGIGIAPEHQEHIFSGFSQAEGSTTRRFGGTGLGLAISKRFVELMGGDIQIKSEPGVGSTFFFNLEMPTVKASTELQSQTQTESNQTVTLPQHVLIVDDNPLAAELTLRMVRSWSLSANLVKSGKEAIELLSDRCITATLEFPYPVIYMDWKMPEMDGWETTRQIRELATQKQLTQPTIIMLTAHGRDMLSHRTEAEQEQINGFLVKPATASMLYDAWIAAQLGDAGIRKLTKGRSSTRQLSGMRILVVEDNLINQQVADELLSMEGAIVSLAANGQLGIEAVAAAAPQFDAVLMDVQMPILDGYEATRAIRQELKLKKLPIIAMTANAMASDRDACLAAGMNEHISKPFDMTKLMSLLIRITGFHTEVAQSDVPDASYLSPVPSQLVPEVAGLEIQTALDRMAGMRSLYVRTAKDFVKILDTALPELQLCLQDGDKKQAMMRLHTLKGNAGTLGATEMAAQAAKLEKLCTTSAGMAECESALAEFAVLVHQTQDKMLKAIALFVAEDATNKPTAAATPSNGYVSDAAREALNNIAALAKAADLEVLQWFAQARGVLGEFPVESIDALDEALQGLDLEAASTICEQMMLSMKN